jgi:hypothetical protein
MRKILFTICFLTSLFGYSQEYHIDNTNINTLKVYEVNSPEQADVLVLFVKNKEQTTKNGYWFIGKKTSTSKPIRYVNFPQQADLKIYQVKIKEQVKTKKGG